jgi:transcriptional regulator with XRE-family HTH domain
MNNYFMNKTLTEFGKLCRSRRALLGINMIQAAKMIGVKQSTITKIEQGEQPVSFEFIRKSIVAYQIKDINSKMEFLLSYLDSGKRIEIPLKELGPLRKEWVAALLILGDIKKHDPDGWDDLINWNINFLQKIKKETPSYKSLIDEDTPI